MTIRAGPKPRVRVSRRAIVERALEIADREGVEGVTFRRLASDLDVTAMALYGHVQDKSDLLSAMGDSVLGEITVSPGLERDWAERLRAYLRAIYAAFDNHRAAGALIARPLVSPAAMRITETLLALLQDGGFTPAQSVRLIQVLTGMILGPVVLASGYGALLGESSKTAAKERASYDDFILAIVEFLDGDSHRVHYIRQPFRREPDFGVTSVNYDLSELLARAEEPA